MSSDQGSQELSPQRILQFGFGYAPPLILEAAIQHRVFDALDSGPKTVEEMAQATGASARGLRILMNALVGLEFLTRESENYSLTPDSAKFLVTTKPSFMGGMFRHMSRQLIPNWLCLGEVVQTGKPAKGVNQEGTGAEFFRDFVEDLFPSGYPAAQAMARELKLSEREGSCRALDLAAGSGVWSIALAEASPQVEVTAVDWAEVLPVTRKVAERHGVGDRYRFVEGDLLEANFGNGYHVATLGHILHSEGIERSRALLKKTFEAMASGGTIAIAEWLVDPDRRGPLSGLIFAVNMLVHTDEGDTFSFDEIRGWLEESGFQNVRTLDVPANSPLILGEKP